MRTFIRDHWKAIVAILLLVVLALFTVSPESAASASPAPSLAERLRTHVEAIASSGHDAGSPAQPEQSARYIEATLENEGYAVRRQEYQAGGQKVHNIEVSIANVAPHARPERIFIVGAHYGESAGPWDSVAGTDDQDSGTAAVLELARLLKDMRPSHGTELKFVFFVNEKATPGLEASNPDTGLPEAGRPDAGSFIAFVGALESSRSVQQALSAFQRVSDYQAHGLAAPDYVQGVTLSEHDAYDRLGYPAIMVTDTAFGRYPYYKANDDAAQQAPAQLDYAGVARVVGGLARTVRALAGEQQI